MDLESESAAAPGEDAGKGVLTLLNGQLRTEVALPNVNAEELTTATQAGAASEKAWP